MLLISACPKLCQLRGWREFGLSAPTIDLLVWLGGRGGGGQRHSNRHCMPTSISQRIRYTLSSMANDDAASVCRLVQPTTPSHPVRNRLIQYDWTCFNSLVHLNLPPHKTHRCGPHLRTQCFRPLTPGSPACASTPRLQHTTLGFTHAKGNGVCADVFSTLLSHCAPLQLQIVPNPNRVLARCEEYRESCAWCVGARGVNWGVNNTVAHSAWLLRCSFRRLIRLNPRSHTTHWCGLFFVCFLLWIPSRLFLRNPFPHTVHWCSLLPW